MKELFEQIDQIARGTFNGTIVKLAAAIVDCFVIQNERIDRIEVLLNKQALKAIKSKKSKKDSA